MVTAKLRSAWQWAVEPNFDADFETRRKIRLLVTIILPLQLGMVLRPLGEIDSLDKLRDPVALTSVVVASMIVVSFLLARTRYYTWGVWLVLAGQAAFTFASLSTHQDLNSETVSSTLIWLIFPILVGGAFFGFRGTLILTGASGLVTILLPRFVPAISSEDIIGAVAFFVTIGILLLVFDRYRAGLEAERRRELAESNQELQAARESLEEQVSERTKELVTVVALSERFNAILDLDDLLKELVSRVQEAFGYYHTHIYLLDDTGQNLVVAEGAGPAGSALKAAEHQIPLHSPTSLVARAARTRQAVLVDDVSQVEDWLSNPMLPDTQSEMAVPILLDGEVMGVLDVQQDQVGGLDEGDVSVLRSLANQVAVTIRNARLFAQVEAGLAEAKAAQARYLEQAWQIDRSQAHEYHYHRPGAPEFDESIKAWAEEEVQVLDSAAVRTPEGDGLTGPSPDVLVTPIMLQDQVIGAMEFLEADTGRNYRWSDQEIALVQAIAGQVALTAENLRLFEETRERADYERLVGEITQKIRQAPNMESLAKMAAEQLGNVLGTSHVLVSVGQDQDTPKDSTDSLQQASSGNGNGNGND